MEMPVLVERENQLRSVVAVTRRKEPAQSPSRVKIVHVTGSGDYLGGAERCLQELIAMEVKCGVECALIAPNRGALTDYVEDLGVPIKVIPYSPWVRWADEGLFPLVAKSVVKVVKNFISEVRFSFALVKLAPSVVHINTSAIGSGYYASKRLGIPVVWHVRELCNTQSGRIFYSPDAQRAIIASSDCVIAVSETVAKTMRPYLSGNNMVTIYDSLRPPSLPRRSDILAGIPVIAIVGNINPAKGQIDAILALVELSKAGIPFKAVVAGDGLDNQYCRDIINIIEGAGIQECITFLGHTDDSYETLMSSDVSLNCSMSESFGRVTVESMLSGCLTIGRNTTGTAELLSSGHGLLYNTVQELSEMLRWAINNPCKARSIASTGAAYAWKQFANIDESGQRVLEVFKHVGK